MRIESIMHRPVVTCGVDDSLDVAARMMWEEDCGVLPVVDRNGCAVAMITDRDICMAAYTQGLPLSAIQVRTAMSNHLLACRPEEDVADAERRMGERQVRRVPVVDRDGRVVGILSLNDLTREVRRVAVRNVPEEPASLLRALAEISAPHHNRESS